MSEKILGIDIADEIKHLSSVEIEELYQRYLDGEKNSSLISEYKIDITPNRLLAVLPPKILEDILCPYCDLPMFTKRRSKSCVGWDIPPVECRDCDHKIFPERFGYRSQQCGCKHCVIIRRRQVLEEENKKRKAIREIYNVEDKPPVDYSELNFFDKLVLLTLFRMQTDEGFEYVLSLDDPSRIERLSPTGDMDVECLKELFSCNALIVDPESRTESFVEDKNFESFYIGRVRWIPNVAFDGVERVVLSELYKEIYDEMSGGIQAHWKDEVFETLFRIATEEVIQYVHVRANELKVNFSAEKKTREVVNQLLQRFSVSEIYYFVKKSVENAHIYYAKGFAINKSHAANTIPNKILSLGERAVDEGWDTYKYSRDSRAPRSYISKVFYDFFLQDEDSGFHKSPGKYWEQEIISRYFCEKDVSNESELYCSECKSQNIAVKMSCGNLELTCKHCGIVEIFTQSK